MTYEQTVEQWGIFELALPGPSGGNPFAQVRWGADFTLGHRTVSVEGFYDGGGVYRVRFMPDAVGDWSFTTHGDTAGLGGFSGRFACTAPSPGNHGPVRVYDAHRFAYADGTAYHPFGTTLYAWVHQGDALEEQTLASLRDTPFNKVRMLVFPKHLFFNANEPVHYPYEGDRNRGWDFKRFNVAFFQHLERRVGDLLALGIEADIILFHGYDRWGFANMGADHDDFYLRYCVARLTAYRNVWWSMANEHDIIAGKTAADWDRLLMLLQQSDPSGHLRSVHSLHTPYDCGKPWVTHQSLQNFFFDPKNVLTQRQQCPKPVVLDEYGYEGDISHGWGSLTGPEFIRRCWEIVTRGGYASGHGETFTHPGDILWWSKGGVLRGQSVSRVAFLRRVLEDAPRQAEPLSVAWDVSCIGVAGEYYLIYLGFQRMACKPLSLPQGRYRIDVIDTWKMTVTPLPGVHGPEVTVPLPSLPYMALRVRRA